MLSHKILGTAGKPWLIFFNALGCDWTMWDSQVALMSESRQILLVNMPGHGGAPLGAVALESMEALAQAVIDLMDHLNIDRAEYCGLSIGGRVGSVLGGQYAGRFSKLVLVCAGMGDPSKADFWEQRIQAVHGQGMAQVAKLSCERWFTPQFASDHPVQVQRVRDSVAACNPVGYEHAVRALITQDTRQATSDIACPTLVVAGAHDLAAPPHVSRAMSDLINGAQYVELDAGHLMNIEAAAAFNRAMVNFLNYYNS